MKVKTKHYNLGVIVGRFQVASLHEAHRDLIQTVINSHPKVLLLLGMSPIRGSINDPLDFAQRKQMILETFPHQQYPNLTVSYIKDCKTDEAWSASLDTIINDHMAPKDSVVLYGGRDSFIPHYKGRFDVLELEADRVISASEIRARISQAPISDPLFRAGVIWASYNRFPTVYSTVDILVTEKDSLILGRKSGESLYRLVGGFVDPTDESFEAAASRELREETGLIISHHEMEYCGSAKINDWRYRNNPSEKIITHLFIAENKFGKPVPSDDIAEVRTFKILDILENPSKFIVDTHLNLIELARPFLKKKADDATTTK